MKLPIQGCDARESELRRRARACVDGPGLASSIGSAYGCPVMRRNLPSCLSLGVAVTLFLVKIPGSAAAAGESEPVLVSVGTSAATASGVTAAFERLSQFQRKKYGATPRVQLRGYVDEVVTRDLALAERGKRSALIESPRVRAQHQLALADALVETLRKRVLHDNPVTDMDVKSYYDAHPELFKTPERIRILRLLVDTEAEAQELLEKAKKVPTMDDWRNLVREKTKDRATSERGGDLGFVAADGTTDVPELEVDRALFAAAKDVKDGELVAHPVPEGKRFAVVWRRGTVAARSVELAQESERIRLVLLNDRVELELRDLSLKLRKEHLHEYHPEQVADREFPIPAEPGAAGSSKGSSAPAPSSR